MRGKQEWGNGLKEDSRLTHNKVWINNGTSSQRCACFARDGQAPDSEELMKQKAFVWIPNLYAYWLGTPAMNLWITAGVW